MKAAMVSAMVFNDEEVPRAPQESPATKVKGEIFLNCRFTKSDFSARSRISALGHVASKRFSNEKD